jgi:membrane associated rhomboid family serine protease
MQDCTTDSKPATSEITGSTPTSNYRPTPMVIFLVLSNIIVFLALPITLRDQYPAQVFKFAANWGPLTLSGQWWRLITSIFVHVELLHLTFNMVGLWILGRRLEQDWGSWIFLFFFLNCSLIGDITILAFHPRAATYGASDGVMGLAGAVAFDYCMRFKLLSWNTRVKLGGLIAYTAYLIAEEHLGGVYAGHTAGLLAGVCISIFFFYFAKSTNSRYWTSVAVSVVVAIAAAVIRLHYRFLFT